MDRNITASLVLILILLTQGVQFAQNGIIKSYYPDRKVKSEISYVNDILDGRSVWYHSNGNIKEEKNFSKGILNGWVRNYYENGNLKEEFNVNNGIIEGDRKKYFEDGALASIESYTEGRLVTSQSFEKVIAVALDDAEDKNLKKNEKLVSADEPNIENQNNQKRLTEPSPVGGIDAIISRLIYPKDALSYGLEGTVVLKAKINEAGKVIFTEIITGMGLGCSEAAADAVMASKFNPGIKEGVPVESWVTLNVDFRLPDKTKDETPLIKEEPVSNAAAVKKYEEYLSVVCEADRCPRPIDDLATIYKLMEIPNVAKALKLRGVIIIEGTVDLSGALKQTQIVEGVGYGCDQQVENALLKSKFTPAVIKGEKVELKVRINFPFIYEMAP